jgi:hypothetical protein
MLHPSHVYFPPTEREGSTARKGGWEKGLRREKRKGLVEGGKLEVEKVEQKKRRLRGAEAA